MAMAHTGVQALQVISRHLSITGNSSSTRCDPRPMHLVPSGIQCLLLQHMEHLSHPLSPLDQDGPRSIEG